MVTTNLKFIPLRVLAKMLGTSYSTLNVYISRPELNQFIFSELVKIPKDKKGRSPVKASGIYRRDYAIFTRAFEKVFNPARGKKFRNLNPMYLKNKGEEYVKPIHTAS